MTRTPPTAIALGAVVVLGSVIAATAHASVWGGARTGVADPVTLLLVLAGSFGLSAVGVLAVRAFSRRTGRAPPHLVHATVVAAVLLSLVAISRTELRMAAPPSGTAAEAPDDGRLGVRLRSDWRGPATRRDREASEAQFDTEVFHGAEAFRRIVLVAGVLALILAFVVRRRAARTPEVTSPRAVDEASRAAAREAIGGSIEAMLSDPDPRTAIIGAYARLQEELQRSDASRRAYEGPTEHLLRVLGLLDVRPDPLRRLIGLFELARFSEHALNGGHRDEALQALRDVASDLTPAGATP